jgi:hypothetical protein
MMSPIARRVAVRSGRGRGRGAPSAAAPVVMAMMVMLSASQAAEGEPIVSGRAPAAVLELRNLMTDAEYRAAGLEKLSAQEVVALDDWIGRLVVRLLADRKEAGCSSPVESRVDGEFEGWTGRTVVQLENGQIWKQRSSTEHYSYRVAPGVLVYRSPSGCEMRVDGVEGEVLVERLR